MPGSRRSGHAGFTEDDLRLVTRAEIEADVRIPGLLAGTYTPHCARVDPARLVRGLADGLRAARRRHLRALAGDGDRAGARATCVTARSARRIVVRATEAFTTRLPGEGRSYLPLASHMLATEPLPPEAWDEIGWASCAPIADQRYQFAYAQRTPDGRIALGGRGLTYKLGGPIREADEAQAAIHRQARADAPPALPGRSRGAGEPSLGLLLRRTARLVHERSTSIARPASPAPAGTRATASSRRASPDARSPT